jgi:Lon-like ATP-dependent protease
LIHVSKTIPRSKVNQAIYSQLQSANTKPLSLRTFSTSRSQNNVSIWGGEGIARTMKNKPVCIGLQPIRSAAQLRRAASSYSTVEMKDRDPKDNPSDQAPPPASNGGAAGGENGSGNNNNGNNGDGKSSKNHSWDVVENQLQKPTVPEVYPQVLALPITGRPLFPGFYKAVVIKEPTVTAAIKELMKRGQPYVGAFLLKDEGLDVDTITNIDQVHQVGVFAQITSVFPATAGKEESGLTAVLYPHRRIKISELLPIKEKHSVAAVEEVASKEAVAESTEKVIEKPKEALESEFQPEKAVAQKTGMH